MMEIQIAVIKAISYELPVGFIIRFQFCRIGSDESFKLWLNDNLVLGRYLESDIAFDGADVKVVLRPGFNKLMIKVVNRFHEWGFLCRITDENGNGFKDVKFYHPQEIDQTYVVK
ncbi:MAG: hypothetical protein P8Y99_12950 [Calditrichaceae bacterium]